MQLKERILKPFNYLPPPLKLVSIMVLAIFCFLLFNQYKVTTYFPIKTVRVYGINHVDREDVEILLMPLVKLGFFSINVESIRERLLPIPWVADILVRRNWPDVIDVTIIEKRAIALWNHRSLISDSGELFMPKTVTFPKHLPLFIGPTGKQIQMLQYYQEINRILLPLHVKIAYLELTAYLDWKLVLDNGIKLQLGYDDILMRLSQFIKVYPKIVGLRQEDVDYIDLRYPNGVAVKWKPKE